MTKHMNIAAQRVGSTRTNSEPRRVHGAKVAKRGVLSRALTRTETSQPPEDPITRRQRGCSQKESHSERPTLELLEKCASVSNSS